MAARTSYVFIAVILVLVAWVGMATPLLAALFAYLTVDMLMVTKRKWLAVILFVIVVSGIFYGFVFFIQQAFEALPRIVNTSVPVIVDYADKHGVKLPFQNASDLQALLLQTVREQLRHLGNFARFATAESVFLIIGIVVALSIFINPKADLSPESHPVKDNLYSACCEEIATRFYTFYRSFATVMGAQIIISAINTLLTAIFLISVSLPYAPVVIGVTFLCGLLPIIGNIISNSVIVGIGFTISPKLAIAALTFLVVLHKLEYFLNSKIIGDRIKNPVWLTLLGLILGERLMGIPGMILAPVILNYVKSEAGRLHADGETPKTG